MIEHTTNETRHADLVSDVLKACSTLSSEIGHKEICRLAHAATTSEGADPAPALLAILGETSDIVRSVSDDDITRRIDWTRIKQDGKHPDLPDHEERFESEQGLALLLLNEVVFLNSHHWEDDWPAEARAAAYLGVNCNDVFAWGCSDAEGAGYHDLETVYRYWRKDPIWGPSIWCMIKRREMPQRPVEKRIREAGIWDLDALAAEHGLRPNHYDGISGVWARQKYEAYTAWERSEGRDPLPYDAGWWDGWKRFTTANPNWQNTAWKAEEDRRSDQWRIESGHEPRHGPQPDLDPSSEAKRLANMLATVAERRSRALSATKDAARSYLTKEAERTERDVVQGLRNLLSQIAPAAL